MVFPVDFCDVTRKIFVTPSLTILLIISISVVMGYSLLIAVFVYACICIERYSVYVFDFDKLRVIYPFDSFRGFL